MIERKLLLRLVLPLVALALISTILIWPPHPMDLLTNLIVEIAGILITVLFVDLILRSREKEKWKHSDILVGADFGAIAIKFLVESTLFLTAGGWASPPVSNATSPDKPWSMVLEHISFDEIHTALSGTDPEDRESFTSAIEERLDELAHLHARHSSRLSAEHTEAILEMEASMRSIQTELSLLDDDDNLLRLADGDITQLEAVISKRLNYAAKEFQDAIAKSLCVFALAFPRRS